MSRAARPDFTHEFIASARPFLGICLDMQRLFDGSQEDAPSPDQPVPGLTPGASAYSAHSDYPPPKSAPRLADSPVRAAGYYDVNFCASIRKGNIRATQLHPPL